MLLSIAVGALVLTVVAIRNTITLDHIAAAWRAANKPLLAIIIVSSAMFHIYVGAHKLWKVMTALRVPITFREVLRVRLGSGPIRCLMPLKAGELVNVMFFWRHKRLPLGRATGGVSFDRGLNVIGAGFWLVVGLVIAGGTTLGVEILVGLLLSTAYFIFFFLSPLHTALGRLAGRLHVRLGRFVHDSLSPFREFTVTQKLYFAAYGVLFMIRPIVVCYLLFLTFGVLPETRTFLACTMLAMFAGHVPTAAGMGPREAAIVFLFRGAADPHVLFSIGILLTLSVIVIPMLIGLPWVPWFLRRITERATPS